MRGEKQQQRPWRHHPPRGDAESWDPAAGRPGTTVSGIGGSLNWDPRLHVWVIRDFKSGIKARGGGSQHTELSIWSVTQILKMPLRVMLLLLTLVAQCWGTPQVGLPSFTEFECFQMIETDFPLPLTSQWRNWSPQAILYLKGARKGSWRKQPLLISPVKFWTWKKTMLNVLCRGTPPDAAAPQQRRRQPSTSGWVRTRDIRNINALSW